MAPNKIPLGFLSCSNNVRPKEIKVLGDELPLDIWGEILLRLPAEPLLRLRAVCKRWRRVIDDPNFAWAHNKNLQLSSTSHTLVFKNLSGSPSDPLYTFDFDALVNSDDDVQANSGYSLDLTNNKSPLPHLQSLPVSTCNGLMLVFTVKITTPIFEILNLSTNERLQLPRLEDFRSDRAMFTGLGYDHAAQDFKVVVIQGRLTRVYSLRSDTWTKINGGPGFYSGWASQRNGVFMCGALHWLSPSDNNIIVALDLGTEKYRQIQLPDPIIQENKTNNKNIDVLGGCLVLSASSVSQFDVWVMKDYGSKDESWTKLLSKKTEDLPNCLVRPVAYIKDKNQVFLKVDGPEFAMFDVESNSMKRVRIQGLPTNLVAQIIPQSIFRLRGGSGTSRIKRMFYRTNKTEEVSVTINNSSN